MNETSSSQRAGTGHSLSTPSDRRAAVHDSCLHAAEPSRRWLRRHVNLALVTILLLAITAPGAFGGTPEQVTLRSGRTYNLYGDILVPTDAGPGVAGALAGNRWPQANLFYEFDASVDNARRNDFRVWLDDWQAEAGTRFIESSTAPDRVLVQIASQIGCGSSVVGMAGGVQDLVISSAAGCWGPRVVLHELGHALGAIHEQQRSDRAAFVTITDHGIVANCGQATWDANYGIFPTTVATAYDYASIMHYPSTAHYTCNGNDVYAEIRVLQAQPAGAPEGSQNDCTTIAACQALLGAGSISARDGYGMAMRYGYRMQAEVVGNGSGSIVVDGNQEGCGTHCYLVTPDSLFIVHALPGADSVASFSGPCVGRECRFLPTGNATVTVRFSRKRSIAAAISALTRPRSERIFRSGFDPQG